LKRDEVLATLVIFLFGAVTAVLSLRMRIGTFRTAGPGLFPLCLGILLMVLSALYLSRFFLQKGKTGGKQEALAKAPGAAKQMVLFLSAITLAILFFNRLGYPLVAFLLMVALLRVLGMKRFGFNLLLSLVTAGVSYFLFVRWLNIPLPKGWIGL
jgi:putative tricarboxylic transport membrane protein